MNGFRNSSRNGQVWRWQRAGSRAVILEVSGRTKKASFITPGIQKAEVCMRFFFFISDLAV